tara:strand:- start:133 stop:333 length:201 start_codon:yes stop_codon:yes gene_type:complete
LLVKNYNKPCGYGYTRVYYTLIGEELKKEKEDKWDLMSMFTPIEVWLLIIATIVTMSVLYSVLSLF